MKQCALVFIVLLSGSTAQFTCNVTLLNATYEALCSTTGSGDGMNALDGCSSNVTCEPKNRVAVIFGDGDDVCNAVSCIRMIDVALGQENISCDRSCDSGPPSIILARFETLIIIAGSSGGGSCVVLCFCIICVACTGCCIRRKRNKSRSWKVPDDMTELKVNEHTDTPFPEGNIEQTSTATNVPPPPPLPGSNPPAANNPSSNIPAPPPLPSSNRPSSNVPAPPPLPGSNRPSSNVPAPPPLPGSNRPSSNVPAPPPLPSSNRPSSNIPAPPPLPGSNRPSSNVPAPPPLPGSNHPSSNVPTPPSLPSSNRPNLSSTIPASPNLNRPNPPSNVPPLPSLPSSNRPPGNVPPPPSMPGLPSNNRILPGSNVPSSQRKNEHARALPLATPAEAHPLPLLPAIAESGRSTLPQKKALLPPSPPSPPRSPIIEDIYDVGINLSDDDQPTPDYVNYNPLQPTAMTAEPYTDVGTGSRLRTPSLPIDTKEGNDEYIEMSLTKTFPWKGQQDSQDLYI